VSVTFSPGDLVRARGREWVALPSVDTTLLSLRPLTGSELDVQLIDPSLESDPVLPAQFDLPHAEDRATQDAALLLGEALRLSLRRGAGPFRSAARVAFDPRAYQLVPLLMALRQQTVRLMIADDVGIGKTIEAGLILRELVDRGEIDRFAVLCPPHLVEQWTGELHSKFDLDTVAVTAASAARLERGLAQSQTLFEANPFTVVSLDYIKAEKRRDSFGRACPPFVIVDEAHSCVGAHLGRQQRFELLRKIAEDPNRHLLLLTATPHSGDEQAFSRLLSLLDPRFSSSSLEDETSRRRLARHFVQRRRIDIRNKDWGEDRSFPPRHDTTEKPYRFNPSHQAFHDAVLDYCLGVVEGAGADQRNRRMAFWSTLALMRCVGSSPAAAHSALRTRLSDVGVLEEQLCDDDEAEGLDVEPAAVVLDDPMLTALVRQAEALTTAPDPKFDAITALLRPLLKDGSNPILFCRFIATAEHVAAGLRKAFPKLCVEAVTGVLTPEDRRARVESMGSAPQRILVATDCLSEGINLQHLFDSVVHYDLSWNPTRHQQREGRVDRFGQSKVVRSVLLYSPDSSIDGAVLEVVLRKAEAIRKATGVTVPLPEERSAVAGALLNALLLRKGRSEQLRLDLGIELSADTDEVDRRWRDAEEGERRSRAVFAQNTLRPDEVIPEWQRWQTLLGGPEEVRRFLTRAMGRLNAALEPSSGGTELAHLQALPPTVVERLAARGLQGTRRITFQEPGPPNVEVVVRSHPLPSTLADFLLESALQPNQTTGRSLGRCGVWATASVATQTTVLLLRLRFKLLVHGRQEKLLLVEEAGTLAFTGATDAPLYVGEEAFDLLGSAATENLAAVAQERIVRQALTRIEAMLGNNGPLATYAGQRARVLLADHERVRSATASMPGSPRVTVEPVLPPDVLGLYVLIPGGV
jgi:superfamily II DNA or RNA helicase/Arc/MetJ family transcription regulator